jgi:galactose mutarotase-like enzyme
MYPSIMPSTIGGMKGFILENEKIRVVVTPGFGARILSLIYKPTETDFVWHNPRVLPMKPTYDPQFEDMSGLFDCFPTCEACTVRGMKLPMYGEVASEPWRASTSRRNGRSATVNMQRKCDVYPMTIWKSLTIDRKEPVLNLNYTVANLTDDALEYHYSGHNTLNVNPNFRILLPPEVTKVKRGMAVTDRLGSLGDEIPWPQTTDRNGNTLDISKLGQPCDGTGENLYTPKLKESWCAAFNESRKEAIGFWFDAEKVPYILVWINCGGYGGYYHVALEPSTGRPDNLEVAVRDWKDFASIQPRTKISWTEKILLSHNVKHIEKVTPDKGIVQ